MPTRVKMLGFDDLPGAQAPQQADGTRCATFLVESYTEEDGRQALELLEVLRRRIGGRRGDRGAQSPTAGGSRGSLAATRGSKPACILPAEAGTADAEPFENLSADEQERLLEEISKGLLRHAPRHQRGVVATLRRLVGL